MPHPHPSRTQQIAAELRDEILRGGYRPGDRLPSERDLSQRFEVHRGAVREALKKLEQLGVAVILPGGAKAKKAAAPRRARSSRGTSERDGQEAVAFLRREGVFARAPRPDLILLDLLLPIMNGVEVLAAVREGDDLYEIPVVILTASSDEEYREQCETLGVEGYIKKPVDLEKFLDIVRALKSHWHADLVLPSMD